MVKTRLIYQKASLHSQVLSEQTSLAKEGILSEEKDTIIYHTHLKTGLNGWDGLEISVSTDFMSTGAYNDNPNHKLHL